VLPSEKADHDDELHQPVREQVDRTEQLGVVQVGGELEQVIGDEVVRVLSELVLREPVGEVVDCLGGDEDEDDSTDELEQAVETLEDEDGPPRWTRSETFICS